MSTQLRSCAASPARSRRSLLTGRAPAPDEAVIAISDQCLLARGIVCQLCTDACEPRALTFRMQAGGAGRIAIDSDACTACGDCVGTCPAGAMALASIKTATPV